MKRALPAPQQERSRLDGLGSEAARRAGLAPAHGPPDEVSPGEPSLEDRRPQRARPAAAEDPGAGEPHLLGLVVAEGLAEAAQEVVGAGEVEGLRVEPQIGSVVGGDVAVQEHLQHVRSQLEELDVLFAVHRRPDEASRRRSSAVELRPKVHVHPAADLPRAPPGPAHGHVAGRARAHLRACPNRRGRRAAPRRRSPRGDPRPARAAPPRRTERRRSAPRDRPGPRPRAPVMRSPWPSQAKEPA